MTDCIFCKVINGELPSTKQYENDDIVVINDLHPAAPIHLLVIPYSEMRIHTGEILNAGSGL